MQLSAPLQQATMGRGARSAPHPQGANEERTRPFAASSPGHASRSDAPAGLFFVRSHASRTEGGPHDASWSLARLLVVRPAVGRPVRQPDERGRCCGSGEAAAQYRVHHGRRSGLWRPGLLRTEEDSHAERRPAGGRGNAVHGDVCGLQRLRSVALRADVGQTPGARLHSQQSRRSRPEWQPYRRPGARSAGRAEAAACAPQAWLRARRFRQMGTRSDRQHGRSAQSGLRSLLRLQLPGGGAQLLPHAPLGQRPPAAAEQPGVLRPPEAAGRRRPGRSRQLRSLLRQRLRPRPDHRAGLAVHAREQRPAVLLVLSDDRASPGAASAGRLAQGVRGQVSGAALSGRSRLSAASHAARRLCGHGHAHGSRSRPDDATGQGTGPGRQDDLHLHQRQRPAVRSARRHRRRVLQQRRRASRPQGFVL